MPWPPTGAYDPVIDIGDQVASPVTPGVATDDNGLNSPVTYDPLTGMMALGIVDNPDDLFPSLPGENEPRLKDMQVDKKRQAVIEWAKTKIGIPYVWGGTSDRGYDCSGLVMMAFKAAGIDMPRISWSQAARGKRVKISDLQPGDLVAWDHQQGDGGADHIALYIGNGQILEAPRTGLNVRIRKLGKNEGAWGVKLAY